LSLALVAGLAGPLAYSIETAATAHSGSSPSAGPAVASARGGQAGRGALAGRADGEFRDRVPGTGRVAPGDTAGRRAGGTGGGGFGGRGGTAGASAALVTLLKAGAPGYKWAAATVGSDSAASMELSTGGVPVMAVGGFSGTDPAPALAQFQQMDAAHQVHYFVAGGAGGGGGGGRAQSNSAQVTAWVEAHFAAKTVGGGTVYDLTAPSSAA
jgi:hypothetical protein